MDFTNKVVVITGSTRGIGKEIAQRFAEKGATVIITGRSQTTVKQARDELIQKGFQAEGFMCDVTKLKNVQEIANKILDKYKSVDILINNAGVTKDNLLFRMSENDFDDVVSINLKGTFNCTKVFTKVMLKAKKGKVINISSIIGIKGNIGQANYAASKAGILGFTKSVALEIASRGITVNAIAPGYVETGMTAELKDNIKDDLLKDIPLGRLGTAEDIAGACLFLASDEANYITGQTVVIDGGMAI